MLQITVWDETQLLTLLFLSISVPLLVPFLLLPPICVPLPLKHQQQGPNPRGYPNPGDYPLLPLPSAQHHFAHKAGYCDPGG